MAAIAGRKLRIMYDSGGTGGAAVIAGARTDNLTINREMIDITDKDDLGVRQFLDGDMGVWSMDANVEGVLTDSTLIALAMDTTPPTGGYDFEIQMPGIGTFTGAWALGNFELTGEEGANPVTFSCGILSSGTITFTAT